MVTSLAVTFLVLKLAGLVSWSWWFVLAPGWVPLMLFSLAVLTAKVTAELGRKTE